MIFFTGKQDYVTENRQESSKAILVGDFFNQYNYQYLLDEKRWVKLNKFPQSVGSIFEIVEINNIFYVIGSKGISTLNNEFHKFPSNKEYAWCATCQVGNNILVISKDYDDDVESSLFNPINKQWSDANIKTKKETYAVVYYLNKVWLIGGRERNADGKWKPVNTVEVYDPVTENQILAPIKMNEARSGHSAIVYKNKLFVFGGYGNDNNGHPLNAVEMFSPVTKKFVMMAPMKIARNGFACCRIGNLVYVVGGSIGVCLRTNSVEIYNLDNNTWTDGVDFPISEFGLYACAVNDKLISTN